MPGPYIFSNRSNIVVSSVFGGRSPCTLCALFFASPMVDFVGAGVEISPLTALSCSASASSDESDSESPVSLLMSGGGVCDSSGAGDSFAIPCFALAVFVDVAPLIFGFSIAPCLPSLAFLRDSFKDKTVGGSCLGSPARMSFFALKIGIQQTWSVKSSAMTPNQEALRTASIACVASSMITTSNLWFLSCLPPDEWQVARTT